VLDRDERAWRELQRRFDPALREIVRHAVADRQVTSAHIDDVLANSWLQLVEDDFRRLRTFSAADGAPLLAWLTLHVATVARERAGNIPRKLPERRPRIVSRGTMLRVEEVAARWEVNVKTIYAMIDRGEIAARRFGRVLRVPRSVVESFEQASVASERR
jgi:excisionase family DNA binding protein